MSSNICVYISKKAYMEMLAEVKRYPYVETGGVMVGVRKGDNFYFDASVDSGIHSRHSPAMCERDAEYVKHLATVELEKYDIDWNEVSLHPWHRHPDGFGRFSSGDIPSNTDFAMRYKGVISSLVLIDPVFRFLSWYVKPNGQLIKVTNVVIDNEAVKQAMPLKSIPDLIAQIEFNEHPADKRILPAECCNLFQSKYMRRFEKADKAARRYSGRIKPKRTGKKELIEYLSAISSRFPEIVFSGKNTNGGLAITMKNTCYGDIPMLIDCDNKTILMNGEKVVYKGPEMIEKILICLQRIWNDKQKVLKRKER